MSASGLEGKVAVVTGAARGIGFAIAAALTAQGVGVWLLDRREEELIAAADRLGQPGTGRTLVVDHTKREEVDSAFARVVEETGRPDVLVANAGWAVYRPFLEIDPDHWGSVIDRNLTGTFHVAQAGAKVMTGHGSDRSIVLVSSISALTPTREFAHYAAAKAGIVALGRVMASELGPDGIRVNVLCPGYIATSALASIPDRDAVVEKVARGVPLGRFGTPEEVAATAVFLASPAASFVNGAVLSISGGTESLDLRSGSE